MWTIYNLSPCDQADIDYCTQLGCKVFVDKPNSYKRVNSLIIYSQDKKTNLLLQLKYATSLALIKENYAI